MNTNINNNINNNSTYDSFTSLFGDVSCTSFLICMIPPRVCSTTLKIVGRENQFDVTSDSRQVPLESEYYYFFQIFSSVAAFLDRQIWSQVDGDQQFLLLYFTWEEQHLP